MIIETLDMIKKLKSSVYNLKRDRDNIAELYETILECCSDKDNFKNQSTYTMKLLNEGKLDNAGEKNWLNYADSVFSSYMAVKVYEGISIDTLEDLNKIIDYYRQEKTNKDIAAFGIYACAQRLSIDDPKRCYELTKEAFTKNPSLGNILDINYVYEGCAAEEHVTERCPFCGSSEAVPHYCSPQIMKLNNNKIFPPSKLWMKCDKCSNLYTYSFPLMSVGTINGHYTKNSDGTVLEPRSPLNVYNDIFCQLKDLSSGTDYLEVGIGNGDMLAVALEFGYHADAVEICREDCERVASALDVNISWCDVVDYETEKQYDVIVMGDVFEHVTDPVKVLKKVSGMLKNDGVLWLSTPNFNCAYARMQKFSHCMWHELNHYTYVSFETLEELLHSLNLKTLHYEMSQRYIGSMELFIKKAADL